MMTDKINVGFIDGDDSSLIDSVYLAGITSQSGFFCGGFYGILGLAYSGLTESYSTCTSSSTGGGQSGGGQSGGGQSGGGQSRGGQSGGGGGGMSRGGQQHHAAPMSAGGAQG